MMISAEADGLRKDLDERDSMPALRATKVCLLEA